MSPIVLGVYIAAPFPLRNIARLVRNGLLSVGLVSTARWLDVDKEDWGDAEARMDLEDIDRATVFLLVNPKEWSEKGTGGRHAEFGYALARHKDIVLLGERTNIFHHHSAITLVGDLTAAVLVANDLARGLSLGL